MKTWAIRVVVAWVSWTLSGAGRQVPLGLDAYVPEPRDNISTTEKVELGRRLFFDRRLSRDQTISCSSCHDPERAFSDGRAKPLGVDGRIGARNTPALLNLAYATRLLWDGRVLTLEHQVTRPIEDPTEMDLSVATAGARVGLSPDELSRALASYVRSILSGDSRYDRFIAGDRAALSEAEQAGLAVFRGSGHCTRCHIGPTLSDDRVHNTGIAWRGDRLVDQGAGDGKFRTPTLREISRTAPYMHDGSLATLEEVISYYDRGGNPNPGLDSDIQPLHLSDLERDQLRQFLETLVGQVTGRAKPQP